MAYIRKLASGWRAEVERNGLRTSKVLPTKREAQAWALETEAKAKTEKAGWRTFKDAADKYVKEVSSKKRGEKFETLRIQAFMTYFGGKSLGDIDAPEVAAWRDSRLKTVQVATVLREVNLLRNIFTKARDEWHWMSHDPFKGVKLPKAPDPRSARWGWRDIRKILRHAQAGGPKSQEVGQAFHIALRTTMRLQECLAAPEGFDKARRVVALKQAKTGARLVPVGRIAAKMLDRPPFTVSANEASTLFAKMTKQVMIDGLTFHDARATAATHLAKKVPVEVLAKITGHRDVAMLVRVYYRPTADEIAQML
jgi:integrase